MSSSSSSPLILWDVKQGSEEWLAVRRCFLTASDFATVLGWNPYMKIEEYVRKLYGSEGEEQELKHKPNKRQQEAMSWGSFHEDDAGLLSCCHHRSSSVLLSTIVFSQCMSTDCASSGSSTRVFGR